MLRSFNFPHDTVIIRNQSKFLNEYGLVLLIAKIVYKFSKREVRDYNYY
jgi:hypothetical protein